MQKQVTAADSFGQQTQDKLDIKPLSIQLPDVHESMKLAGIRGLDPKQARSRLLCCCGVSGCGIGPMTQVVEER